MTAQTVDAELASIFKPVATALRENESSIIEELIAVQGSSVDTGGYYKMDDSLTGEAMRPSQTLNDILANI